MEYYTKWVGEGEGELVMKHLLQEVGVEEVEAELTWEKYLKQMGVKEEVEVESALEHLLVEVKVGEVELEEELMLENLLKQVGGGLGV